jgi:hypothetical protein
VLRGRWLGNLDIFDGEGRTIGKVARPDLKELGDGPVVYTFSDSEERFELRLPSARRPDSWARVPARHPSRALELRSAARDQAATLWVIDHPRSGRGEIEHNHETIARFAQSAYAERMRTFRAGPEAQSGVWSGSLMSRLRASCSCDGGTSDTSRTTFSNAIS